MKIFLGKTISLFCVLCVITGVKGEYASCMTPSGYIGNCMPLTGCPSLSGLAANTRRTKEQSNYLQNSLCGPLSYNLFVCCPVKNLPPSKAIEALPKIDSFCQTPDGETGECVILKSCSILLELARKPTLTRWEISYLRKSKCGNANGEIMVCCPETKWTVHHTTTSTTTTPTVKSKMRNAPPMPETSCDTAVNKPGKCISIKSCSTLLEIVTRQDRTPLETLYLQHSQCGYDNGEFMVCCPETKSTTQTAPNTKAIQTTTTTAPTHITMSPTTSTAAPPMPETSCHTAANKPGKCISIKSCSTLLEIVTKQDRTPLETLYLQHSQCGYDNGKFMVCCPETKSTTQTAPDTKAIQTTTTTAPTHITMSPTTSTAGPNIVPPKGDSNKWTNEPGCGKILLENRIYGGSAAHIDEYTWVARIIYIDADNNMDFFCGGSLINQNYVLTAAHCVFMSEDKKDWYIKGVRLGEWNTTTEKDCEYYSKEYPTCAPRHLDIDILEHIVHPKYNKNRLNYDIALLKLEESVTYTDFINPICLPLSPAGQQTINYENKSVEVVGWGKTETREHSEIKLYAYLNVQDIKKCGKQKGRTENQICAKGEKGTDSCNGDSGGPLMLRESHNNRTAYYLIGLVSFGAGGECGDIQTNGFYMRVVNFMDWIADNTQNSS